MRIAVTKRKHEFNCSMMGQWVKCGSEPFIERQKTEVKLRVFQVIVGFCEENVLGALNSLGCYTETV